MQTVLELQNALFRQSFDIDREKQEQTRERERPTHVDIIPNLPPKPHKAWGATRKERESEMP